MIHYYTNRELSDKLEINLARWKRWSRSFLPPDPLGGMQSGYARQYAFKDLLKVFMGGYLLSHLKLSVQESRQVMDDLSPWLKKAGFFDLNGFNGGKSEKAGKSGPFRIYFCPLTPSGTTIASGFGYLIRRSVCRRSDAAAGGRRVTETFEETLIQSDAPDGRTFLEDPNVRIINLTAMVDTLVEKLDRKNG
jgi:hypothetical protein